MEIAGHRPAELEKDRGDLQGVIIIEVSTLAALVVCLSQMLGPSQEPDGAPPVSLDRIRKQAAKAPAIKVEVRAPDPRTEKPVATFRTNVEGRVYMLPFLEYLRKEFEMNELQRQSQEWRSKCCGVNLLSIPPMINRAVKKHQAAEAHEQVTRELAEIEAARKK